MFDREKEAEFNKKKITEYFLNDIKRMKKLAEENGGKIEATPSVDKKKQAAIEQVKKHAESLGVKIEVEQPEVTGVSYNIEKPIYVQTYDPYEGCFVPELNRPLYRYDNEKVRGWWGRKLQWFVSKFPKKRKKWKKGEGVANLDGLVDNLDTRAAKHEMNEILKMADVEGCFKFTKKQLFVEKWIGRKNRVKNAFVEAWSALRGR
jgi:hypothetical protein